MEKTTKRKPNTQHSFLTEKTTQILKTKNNQDQVPQITGDVPSFFNHTINCIRSKSILKRMPANYNKVLIPIRKGQ